MHLYSKTSCFVELICNTITWLITVHLILQEAPAASQHCSILLLLRTGLPVADHCSRHQAVAAVHCG